MTESTASLRDGLRRVNQTLFDNQDRALRALSENDDDEYEDLAIREVELLAIQSDLHRKLMAQFQGGT